LKISKIDLKEKVEGFICDQLDQDEYDLVEVDSKDLLTWNRLDLGFKLFYLENHDLIPQFSRELYEQDIKAQTMGDFVEFGNEKKNSFDKYLKNFDQTFLSIKNNGFDFLESIIPLSESGSILNGAHRTASLIQLGGKATCIKTNLKTKIDFKYFYERNVSERDIQIAVNTFVEFSPSNVYLAFLWPSAVGAREEALSHFSNIIFSKDLKLTSNGAFNILYELYKHMDWVGNERNGYSGIQQKLLECFPRLDKVKVIVFQAKEFDDVLAIKEKIRNIYNIGFSSIHITDTKEEAIRISRLLFNENGLHFLNYGQLTKNQKILDKLDKFKEFLLQNEIPRSDICIDGSLILKMYGLRDNDDVDFLLKKGSEIINPDTDFETHDSELKYHDVDKNDLIYNPSFYFEYYGLKFISFKQLFKMKKNRNEQKDIIDCNLMKHLNSENSFKLVITKVRQRVLYAKIRLKRNTLVIIMNTLRGSVLYKPVRQIYRWITSNR
jgi:hypothetical protein